MKKIIFIIALFLSGCGGGYDQRTEKQDYSVSPYLGQAIFIGDSFIDLHDWSDDFPNSVNEGVSGETTEEILTRVPGIIENYEPQQVFIIAGINDINRDSRSARDIYGTYSKIIDELTANNFKVTVISTCHFADLGIFSDELNPIVSELNAFLEYGCEQRGLAFIDLALIVCPLYYLESEYDSGDGVHMNESGYDVMVWLINSIFSNLKR